MAFLKKCNLEISLKPFKETSDQYIEQVCRTLFRQWMPLIDQSETVSVMYWAADGSEILDYKGDLTESFEWGKYMGGANPRGWDKEQDPEKKGLHSRCYLYIENPPVFTYGDFARLNRIMKRVGQEMTGKPVLLEATFDPGPEFAVSPFKYQRHTEILRGVAMGPKSFVCCYGVLDGDKVHYAAFPKGIPDKTPFGTFFGAQCRHFLRDLGFDLLWLSNGFGFGTESWGVAGAVFDGERFELEKLPETQQRILDFWRLFRKECPNLRVETRGTNLTVGIDFATDGVNYQALYSGSFDFLPPPNSPWAALDGDFGLEICGYLSRIARLPEQDYLFRFYVHDPWWVNSPWLDRYEGQPHDIYLPLAACRMNGQGEVEPPRYLSLLSVDNTYGELPERCPREVIPHLLRGYETCPDAVSPLLWVYPFTEYQDITAQGYSAQKPFFEDWYMRNAINAGLPLATVAATEEFCSALFLNPQALEGRIVVSPFPTPDSSWEKGLLAFLEQGGQVMLYGHAAPGRISEMLGLSFGTSLSGKMLLSHSFEEDTLLSNRCSPNIFHNPIISDGGIDTTGAFCPLAFVEQEQGRRVYAAQGTYKNGRILWVRGTNSAYFKEGSHLLIPHNPSEYYDTGRLMRLMLNIFGLKISFALAAPDIKRPVLLLSRNRNALWCSAYNPNTTTAVSLSTQWGAPAMMGFEGLMVKGTAQYHFPRAVHAEIRAFVEQEEGIISCRELCPVSAQIDRRWQLDGLVNATVRFLPETKAEDMEVLLNSQYPHMVGEPFQLELEQTSLGEMLTIRGVTGSLFFGRKDGTSRS